MSRTTVAPGQLSLWQERGIVAPPAPPAGTETRAEVPIPPSTNALFATFNGRRIPTREYKAWRALVVPMLARLAAPKRYPVEVRLTIIGKVNQQRDLDNFGKPLMDAIVEAGVITDDNLKRVHGITLRYEPGSGEPVARVEIVNPNEVRA